LFYAIRVLEKGLVALMLSCGSNLQG
jgi:hypothetical protein